MSQDLLTLEDVASQLGTSNVTVRRLTIAGRLPAIKLERQVRYRKEDLERFLNNSDWRERRKRRQEAAVA